MILQDAVMHHNQQYDRDPQGRNADGAGVAPALDLPKTDYGVGPQRLKCHQFLHAHPELAWEGVQVRRSHASGCNS